MPIALLALMMLKGVSKVFKEFFSVVDGVCSNPRRCRCIIWAPSPDRKDASLDESEPPVRTFQANSLADFTEWVTLRTDMDTMSDDGAAVTLMTIHPLGPPLNLTAFL